jgi:hypothetical protein
MAPPRRGGFTGSGILSRFFGSAISNAAGYSIGGAVQPTLEPYTQDIANETWALHAVRPLSAQQAAALSARGIDAALDPAGEAKLTGYNAERFAALAQLGGEVPDTGSLLTMLRRGAISDGEFDAALGRAAILPEWRARLRALRRVLPSVTDMVRFAVREVYNPTQRAALDLDAEFPAAFAEQARAIGLEEQTARDYWAAHWELPSVEQGAAMLFRGEISQSEFEALVKALDYAPIWRQPLQAISRAIPGLSDMIRFAVREVYNPTQRAALGLDGDYPAAFTAQAAKHGLAEPDARDYWAAHWQLPSARQGYTMLWRGLISPAQLDELLKALDYSPVWRDRLSEIAHIVPGRIDLKRMLHHGIIDRAGVKQGYIRIGYAEPDAEHMTQIAEAEQTASPTAQVWAGRARSRLFTVAHNEYQDGSIDAAQARSLVQRVGASSAEADAVLAVWDAEREVNRLELTPAQIRKAWKDGLYDEPTALAELAERHMTAEDAATFLHS